MFTDKDRVNMQKVSRMMSHGCNMLILKGRSK
jgi:hypothetical protein